MCGGKEKWLKQRNLEKVKHENDCTETAGGQIMHTSECIINNLVLEAEGIEKF